MESRWQPIMLVASHRVECECGALAIFVILDEEEVGEDGKHDFDYTAWCQSCFEKAQAEVS